MNESLSNKSSVEKEIYNTLNSIEDSLASIDEQIIGIKSITSKIGNTEPGILDPKDSKVPTPGNIIDRLGLISTYCTDLKVKSTQAFNNLDALL